MKTVIFGTSILVVALLAPFAKGDTAPFINIQPLNQTNYNSSAATFIISAGGSDPLTYQWQKNQINLEDNDNVSGSSTDTLGLNNISPADSGMYSVLVSNNAGGLSSSGAVLVVYTRLVQNGGFETGGLSPWTKSGNTAGFSANSSSAYVHSGSRGARIGPSGFLGYLSQTLPTITGQSYLISCWLSLEDNGDGVTPNQFDVVWNGNPICSQTNLAATDWTNLQFVVTATGTNSLLSFGFQNDPSYFGFDDATVLPVPAFQSAVNVGSELLFTWNALAGFQYQLQSCTNLTQPYWNSFGSTFFTETNAIATGTDAITPSAAQRFYRVGVLP